MRVGKSQDSDLNMLCTKCGHEDWCHSGADKQYCETFEWIKVDGPFPLPDYMVKLGIKGMTFESEYGPSCECSGFTIGQKKSVAATKSGLDQYLVLAH